MGCSVKVLCEPFGRVSLLAHKKGIGFPIPFLCANSRELANHFLFTNFMA